MRSEPTSSTSNTRPVLLSPQRPSKRSRHDWHAPKGLCGLPNEVLAGRIVTLAIAQGDGRSMLQTNRRLRDLTIDRVQSAVQQQNVREHAYILSGATQQASFATEDALFVQANLLRTHLLCPAVTLQQWSLDQRGQGALHMSQAQLAWRSAQDRLNLRGHKITHLPARFLQYQSALRYLQLDRNRLTSIPSCIGALPGLIELTASGNQLSDLPATFVHLKQLRVLSLNDNLFDSIPRSLLSLPQLKTLKMRNNAVSDLPSRFLEMNLQNLILDGNLISSFPRFNAIYTAMKTLCLSNNQIASVPPEIFSLDLLELDLSGNRLTALELPERASSTLQLLCLDNNDLQNAENAWDLFPRLKTLTLHRNAITQVPTSLFFNRRDLSITLYQNPLSAAEIIQRLLASHSFRGILCVDDSQVSEMHRHLKEIYSNGLHIRIFHRNETTSGR